MGSPSRNVQYHPPRLSEDRLNLPQPHSPSLPTHCSGKSGMRPIKQASAYRRFFGSQPSLVTAPNTFGLLPDRRAPFWTFARRSGTVPWEGRQTCDGCDDRIPGTYIRRAPNLRPLHRSPEASPVRSGRCCLRGCQSLPLVQRSPADERERTRTGTAPAGPGVGAQAPARTSRPTSPKRLLVRPRTPAVSSARSRASTKAPPKRPPARCRLWVWAARGAVTTACIGSMPR